MTHIPKFPPVVPESWLHTEPLTQKRLETGLVLFDFWTYSCVNCLRTLPHIKRWHEKYAHLGLLILGIHTPEFEFEKEKANVETFAAEEGIAYPLVQDNDYGIWSAFANHYWPNKYLALNGRIIYEHAGEGAYEETERAIQTGLAKLDPHLELPALDEVEAGGGGICYPMTPELYCGFKRGMLGGGQEPQRNRETQYELPATLSRDLIHLSGTWLSGPESLSSSRVGSRLVLPCRGVEVNVVSNSGDAVMRVHDGNGPLSAEYRGADVDKDALLHLTEPRMYRLVAASTYHEYQLELELVKGEANLYAFTFGSCATPA